MRPIVTIALILVQISFFLCCAGENEEFQFVILCPISLDNNCSAIASSENCLSEGLLDLDHPYFEGEPLYHMVLLVENKSDYNEFDTVEVKISYNWLTGREKLKNNEDLKPLLQIEDENRNVSLYGNFTIQNQYLIIHLHALATDLGTVLTVLGAEAEEFTLGIDIQLSADSPENKELRSREKRFPVEFCWGCLSEVCPDNSYPSCTPGQDSNNMSCI